MWKLLAHTCRNARAACCAAATVVGLDSTRRTDTFVIRIEPLSLFAILHRRLASGAIVDLARSAARIARACSSHKFQTRAAAVKCSVRAAKERLASLAAGDECIGSIECELLAGPLRTAKDVLKVRLRIGENDLLSLIVDLLVALDLGNLDVLPSEIAAYNGQNHANLERSQQNAQPHCVWYQLKWSV